MVFFIKKYERNKGKDERDNLTAEMGLNEQDGKSRKISLGC